MIKVSFSEEPPAVYSETVGINNQLTRFRIRTNIQSEVKQEEMPPEEEGGDPVIVEVTTWTADEKELLLPNGELNKEDIEANPEAYVNYIPKATRDKSKQIIQVDLDAVRNGRPSVEVPTYRAGARVCHGRADDIFLLGGLQMGGLPFFEFADGSVEALTIADLQAILTDIATWETTLQQVKQQFWGRVEAAQSEEELTTIEEEFRQFLATM